jgi:hypothetical protein
MTITGTSFSRSCRRLGARPASAYGLLAVPLAALSACAGFSPAPSTYPSDAGAETGSDASSSSLDGSPEAEASVSDAAPEAEASVPAVCDPTTNPTAPPCLIGALFVAPTGSDANDGSPQHPFATVGHALHEPNSAGRIIICQGQYTERVALAGSAVANLYGGFACPPITPLDAGSDATTSAGDAAAADAAASTGWTPGGGPSVFAPPTYDPQNNWVLAITGVTTPVQLENLSFVAPTPSGYDTAGNGNSSLAAVVIGSSAELVDVALRAGRGVDGAAGAPGNVSPNFTAPAAQDGTSFYVDVNAVAHLGIGGTNNGCKYVHDTRGTAQSIDSSAGGNGGDVGLAVAPTPGTANPLSSPDPGSPLPLDGQVGTAGAPPAANGHPGAYGAPRPAGAAATALGTLVATAASITWQPASGGPGGTGAPGQGGGGGLGDNPMGVDQGGGGGGAGGCGGAGGAGGTGGGASVALVSVNNVSLTLTTCALTTGGGGSGGAGGAGDAAQPGGQGGTAVANNAGGNGGAGAGGSGGGGGTGGLSAGVLYRGATPPVLQSCTLTIGDPGHGGAAGSAGSASAPWAGLSGGAGFDEYHAYGTNLANVTGILQAP